MVMKQATEKRTTQESLRRPRRLGVAEAKSRLSELLRDAASGPTIIHSRGRDVAVVLAVEEYERLTAENSAERKGGTLFLERVDALKRRYDGGVGDFAPRRLAFEPVNPFARKPKTRP
jgi:prevent-host-death family protein